MKKDQRLSESDKELFYRRYANPLRGYFAKRVGANENVDDLIQELMRRLFGASGNALIGNPDGYVFQAAANLLKESYRKAGTRDSAIEELAYFQPIAEEIDPERILQGKQELSRLEKALAELPPRTRKVFLMHRFENFKYREIAERIGISVSAVEKHIANAAKHISVRMRR